MHTHLHFPVVEQSQVGNARREAANLARMLNLQPQRIAEVELVVTEAATNLLRHAGGGQILVRGLEMGAAKMHEGQMHGAEPRDVLGIEVLALDRGPGIANIADGMRDGYSTAGGLGGGLGAMKRLSSEFDLYSVPGKGTAVRAVLWPVGRKSPNGNTSVEIGAVCVAKRGEEVSGDAWVVELRNANYMAVVVDGLGHGPDAAAAANVALRAVSMQPKLGPVDLIHKAHLALRATRGAALAIGSLDVRAQSIALAGVGNISVSVTGGTRRKHLISHNGIVGHELRKVQEFSAPWPPDAFLIMHSDGMSTHWDLDAYPGLLKHHAGLVAAVLYRDFCRERDDVTVVAIRNATDPAQPSSLEASS